MSDRLSGRLLLLVFAPFAAGYFLSYFFRYVNAVISRELAAEFALSPADLGFLTSTYLLAFAAFQLPLGVLLDRYGPRRVVAALLCVAAAGALLFAVASGFVALALGRALIGLGVSAGLMGAIKAFTLWFPLSRLATLNGLYLAVGGLGGIAATAPAEALLGSLGWRTLFVVVCAMSAAAALLVFWVVPEKALPGEGQTLRRQVAGFGAIFASRSFWRMALPLVVCQAAYMTMQGLWLGPWLYDIAGQTRDGVARYLFATALAFMAGSIFFGVGADRLASRISHLTLYKAGLSVSVAMFVLLAAGVQVVSSTLAEADLVSNWGDTTILRTLDDVAAVKEGDGGPIIIHGSANLNQNLADAGLIDRYHLLVFPVLLGAGKRLFSDTDKDKQLLKVVESETYGNGIQKLVYDVVH
jgi:MFS family permease